MAAETKTSKVFFDTQNASNYFLSLTNFTQMQSLLNEATESGVPSLLAIVQEGKKECTDLGLKESYNIVLNNLTELNTLQTDSSTTQTNLLYFDLLQIYEKYKIPLNRVTESDAIQHRDFLVARKKMIAEQELYHLCANLDKRRGLLTAPDESTHQYFVLFFRLAVTSKLTWEILENAKKNTLFNSAIWDTLALTCSNNNVPFPTNPIASIPTTSTQTLSATAIMPISATVSTGGTPIFSTSTTNFYSRYMSDGNRYTPTIFSAETPREPQDGNEKRTTQSPSSNH